MSDCATSKQRLIAAALVGALAFTTTFAQRPTRFGRGTPSIGRLDKGLDEAKSRGWTVVSMKDDWNTVFTPTRP